MISGYLGWIVAKGNPFDSDCVPSASTFSYKTNDLLLKIDGFSPIAAKGIDVVPWSPNDTNSNIQWT